MQQCLLTLSLMYIDQLTYLLYQEFNFDILATFIKLLTEGADLMASFLLHHFTLKIVTSTTL